MSKVDDLSQQIERAPFVPDKQPAPEEILFGTEDAPLKGRAESCYTYTVIDTIGGGSSEIQKNIIAKRKLDLPKNF